MRRLVQVLCLLTLMACHDKVVCPAFQSTYILDDSTRYAFFSYVWQLDEETRNQYLGNTPGLEDSLDILVLGDSALNPQQPKVDYYAYAGEKVVPWRVRGRTKYGIVKYEPYWLKKYRMRTAPMENVFAPKPPKEEEVTQPDSIATDSLAIPSTDSLLVAAQDSINIAEAMANWEKEKEEVRFLYDYDPNDDFNVEQEYYNKYYGERFIDKRPLPPPFPLDSLGNPIMPEEGLDEEKKPFFEGVKDFFSNLFKKNESDTTAFEGLEVVPIQDEEAVQEDPVDDSGNE